MEILFRLGEGYCVYMQTGFLYLDNQQEVYVPNNENQVVPLADGRKLGYAEYGDVAGFPVLYFHGLPGSRFEAEKLAANALEMQIRLIGIDRPGMGLSSPKKKRTITDWAKDIEEFCHALNLESFSIIGHSGGAPYIAACARHIPQRIHRAVIVSGLAPFDYPETISSLPKSQKNTQFIAKYFPILLKCMMRLSFMALEKPWLLKKMLKQLPEVDAKIFENLRFRNAMIASLKEAFRQNTSAEYRFLEEEGHISILYNHADEILASARE